MPILLFAYNCFYPSGGMNDLVAVCTELTEKNVFDIVAEQIRSDKLLRDDRLRVHSAQVDETAAASPELYEFRMADSLDDPSFEFASIKEVLEGLGPCALVPISVASNESGASWKFATRDPDKNSL